MKRMNILPIADMHIESYWQSLQSYRGEADVVVAAGDIHTKSMGPAELRRIFAEQEIVYISGNHEYYGSSIEEEDKHLREESQKHGIHFLQCDSVEIDGIIFCGCTLWTDFLLFGVEREADARFEVGRYLRDYHVIKAAPRSRRRLSTLQTMKLHRQHRAWLADKFVEHQGKPLVVATNHGPSFKCIHPGYQEDLSSAGFASNLDDLVELSNAKHWICGHSHIGQHFKIGHTTVWQNSMGYDKELIEGFNPCLTIEV